MRAGPPVQPGPTRDALLRWVLLNAPLLREGIASGAGARTPGPDPGDPADWELLHALPTSAGGSDAPVPHRYLLLPPEPWRPRCWVLLVLPDGCVLPANTTFTDPASRFLMASGLPRDAAAPLPGSGVATATRPLDHAGYLLGCLPPGEPVRLFAAVSQDVAWLLRQGEVDALGLDAPCRPLWQRGRYLFTSPNPAVATYFHNKSCVICFAVPRSRLCSAVESGLLGLHLFLADNGETLDPQAQFGAPDIALEVVALGAAGVRWLLDFLEQRQT